MSVAKYGPDHVCDERHERMREAVESTTQPRVLAHIAPEFGITRERLRQLTVAHGWQRTGVPHPGEKCVQCGLRWKRKPGQSRSESEHEHRLDPHHRAVVEERMKAHDERLSRKYRHWDKDALVVALYEAGYTGSQIAWLADCASIPDVWRRLVRAGVPRSRLRWQKRVHSGNESAVENQP